MRSLSLRLTHKITAIGVVGLMGVVLVGGIHLYGENAVAVYRSAAESARSVAELNRQIEVELLEGRRAEKDFLLRNDAKKADSQVEIANEVFAPTEDEIEHARKVVAAYREAEAAGRGASGLDGMLVDAAHLRHADNINRKAELLGR